MSSFCKKLESKGFTKIGSDGNLTMFAGDFTGRQADVGVAATDDGENVYSVGVFFDASKDWKTLVNTYDYYKDLYTKKYGKPSASNENNPSYDNSNTTLMIALSEGKVTWCSEWNVTGGTIELSIVKGEHYEGMVFIKYHDAQNVEAKIQNDLDDI